MKNFFTSLLMALSIGAFAQVDVVLQVDMNGQSVSPDGVHVAGSFNGWNTGSNMLTDMGGGIYSTTLSLTPGDDVEYKFLNGNAWGTEETPSSECSVGTNNRIFTTPAANLTLALTPFSGCPNPSPTQDVTFCVDMSNQTVSSDGVYVAGNFNGWWPDATPMTDIGGSIYTATVTVPSSITNLQYKYLNGNAWGTEEVIPSPCINTNTNREFTLEGAGATVDLPCLFFSSCDESPFVLPVEFAYLKGFASDRDIELIWGTLTEENNQGFEVQYSTDGQEWEPLQFVRGEGTTVVPQTYEYHHRNVNSIFNYYRLKQMDFDGKYEYSPSIAIQIEELKTEVSVFPNPLQNELTIEGGNGTFRLFNQLGQPVIEKSTIENRQTIDVSDYEAGVYTLVITMDDGSVINKILVKHTN